MLPDEYNHIDRYRQYLSETFAGDPRLAKCSGATNAKITEFQRVAGRDLPSLYLGYLSYFGGNDGPIRLCDDCDSSAAAIVEYLEASATKEYPVLPPDCVMIGIRALSFARCLWYQDPIAEPKVIINDWEHVVRIVADSFGTHLYRQTWRHRYFRDGTIILYGGKDIRLTDVETAVVPMGFEPMFFSDEYQFTAKRGELKFLSRHEADGIRVLVAGDDEWRVGRAADEIQRALGLQER